jgi:hypothetical protein
MTPAQPYPKAGDVWRSRDKRDHGLTVTVQLVDEYNALVHIKRFRHSKVQLRRWLRDYEFVSRSAA